MPLCPPALLTTQHGAAHLLHGEDTPESENDELVVSGYLTSLASAGHAEQEEADRAAEKSSGKLGTFGKVSMAVLPGTGTARHVADFSTMVPPVALECGSVDRLLTFPRLCYCAARRTCGDMVWLMPLRPILAEAWDVQSLSAESVQSFFCFRSAATVFWRTSLENYHQLASMTRRRGSVA